MSARVTFHAVFETQQVFQQDLERVGQPRDLVGGGAARSSSIRRNGKPTLRVDVWELPVMNPSPRIDRRRQNKRRILTHPRYCGLVRSMTPPPQAAIAVVQHRELSGRDRARCGSSNRTSSAPSSLPSRMATLVGLPIANLDLRMELHGARLHQPVARTGGQRTTDEQRMIVSLHREQLVAARDSWPRRTRRLRRARRRGPPISRPAPLAERVERETAIAARPLCRSHRRCRRATWECSAREIHGTAARR